MEPIFIYAIGDCGVMTPGTNERALLCYEFSAVFNQAPFSVP